MIVDNPELKYENTDKNTDGLNVDKIAVTSNLDDIIIL
jgi:hypothetical protein